MFTSTRFRRVVVGALLALALMVPVAGCGADSSIAPAPIAKPTGVGTPMNAALPSRILNLPFTDSAGRTVRLSDLSGKTIVISDMMTLCQEACPIDTTALLQTEREVAAADPKAPVVYLSITVDPVRDTPAQLAAYRKQFAPPGALSQWRLLTGKPADVHALWRYLGVYWEKTPQDDVVHNWRTGRLLTYDIAHSDEVFVVDGHGRERFILDGIPSLGGDPSIPAKISAFMNKEGRHNARETSGWTAADAVDVLSWVLDKRL